MGKDNGNGLWGVALGALIVGTTLALRDFFEDPKNREAVRSTVKNGYDKVKGGVERGYAVTKTKVQEGYATAKTKVEEGYATAKTKVQEGYAIAKTKVGEGIATVRDKAEKTGKELKTAVENNDTVKKIKAKVEDLRRATADPIEEYFREDMEAPVEEALAVEASAEEVLVEEAPAEDATTAVWDTPTAE